MNPVGGLRLTVLAGPTLPVPVPALLAERVRSVVVTESDEERSVFSLVLAGAGWPAAVPRPLGPGSVLAAFSRVVLVVAMGGAAQVLSDGIVTDVRLDPGVGGAGPTWVITGEDLGNLLDREEKDTEHPGLDDLPVVAATLLPYSVHGLLPRLVPPPVSDPPLPIDRVPTQQGTDLAHLVALATRHGYVAYAMPGDIPGTSYFYWGPPVRAGLPQPALAVDLGPDSNVSEVTFRTEATRPTSVRGDVQDRRTGEQAQVSAPTSSRAPLSASPLAAGNAENLRVRRLRDGSPNTTTAQARAQGAVDAAADAVTAEGTADGVRYRSVLRPRALVGLRGAGWEHDGIWYAKRVEHTLQMGSYAVKFTLTREGHGATMPTLPRVAS